STTNTYYIKSAADDTRAAMTKLERMLIGNESAASGEKNGTLLTDNKVATQPAESKPLPSSKRPVYCYLNLVAAVGLEPTTYGYESCLLRGRHADSVT